MNPLRSLAHLKSFWAAYVVLLISLALTVCTYFGFSRYVTHRESSRFASESQIIFEQVEAQMNVYLTIMKGVRALYSGSELVTPKELANYFHLLKIEDLQKDSGLEGIGLVWVVPPDERQDHLEWMRNEYPQYSLRTTSTNQVAYPIVHIEALNTNKAVALGWDLSREPERFAALERARDTAEPAITKKTKILMADGNTGATGYIIYLPIFEDGIGAGTVDQRRSNIRGFVFGTFNPAKLWKKLLLPKENLVDLEVYDGDTSSDNLIYDRDGTPFVLLKRKPLFTGKIGADVLGRRWNFQFYTLPQMESTMEHRLPLFVLLTGLFSSVCLFGLVFIPARGKAFAERISRELQHSESALRGANIELARSLALQITTLEATADGILVLDRDGGIVSFNKQFLSMWRLAPAVAESKDFSGIIEHLRGQLSNPDSLALNDRAFSGDVEKDSLYLIQFKDGRMFEVSSRPQRSGQAVIGSVLSFRDVTEEKAAEERLRESQSLYYSLVENLPQCIYRKDLQGRFVFANTAFCNLLAVRQHEIIGKTDYDFFPPERAEKYEENDKLVFETKKILEQTETYTTKAGTLRYVQSVKTPLFDSRGAATGVLGIFWDITEKKLADQNLSSEKERLAVTLRSIADAVITTNIEGRVEMLNPVAERVSGFSQEEAAGKLIQEVMPLCSADMKGILPAEYFSVQAGQTSHSLNPALLVTKDGKDLFLQKRSAPICDNAGQVTGAVFVFHDVTQQRQREQELFRSSKLESVGLLAGGIAHDFNNVLTGIVGNLSLIREHPDLPKGVSERLGMLEAAAYKARHLTLQLLTFAKGGSPIKQTASVVEVIRDSTEFALRGSNIRPEFSFPADLAAVEIDAGQIGQVIQNLVINSTHAMPSGGVLKISAQNRELDGNSRLPLSAGSYITVSIQDSGCGIKAEHLSRIFDPYFTTKDKGSGLGLATAYSIMKRHDGLITVESEIGKGSTFHLYLPASRARIETTATEPDSMLNGGGRILAMDDEEGIRTLLAAILKHFGYEVTTVADGAAALQEYQSAMKSGLPFAAVIMDLTIPGGMGGKETISQLRVIDPKVKAIVSSGYSNDPVMAEYQSYGFIGRVEKPYRIQELGKTIARVVSNQGVLN
jgi:PAS domain S-box-containing protein